MRPLLLLALMLQLGQILPIPVLARGPQVYRGQGECREIALTYDTEFDRPTADLLTLLEKERVKATFFLMGKSVEDWPKLARRVAASHQIGSHSYSHPAMSRMSREQVIAELNHSTEALMKVIGVDPRPLFRPPYGRYSQRLIEAAEAAGYGHFLLWSIDTRDWNNPPSSQIERRLVEKAFPGAIVLMHGYPANTVTATAKAIQALRAKGYQFVTATEILGIDRGARDFGGDHYWVQPGDRVEKVATCHNLHPGQLLAYNNLQDLAPGAVIKIPHRNEVTLLVNGERPSLPTFPRLEGRTLYVPLAVGEQLGARRTDEGAVTHLYMGKKEVRILPNQAIAWVNGRPTKMGGPSIQDGQELLVPLPFLATALGLRFQYDPIQMVIQLTSKR
jgi:peptidoglycan/xylan/chitin deacetylase (PgdA/CDA1 family)